MTIILVLAACQQPTLVQEVYSQEEFKSRESTIGGNVFKYRVYVPSGRKGSEILPVMLYLHGAGNRGNDNESQLNGLADVIRANKDRFSFIVVVPQCKTDRFWDGQMIAGANRAIDDVITEFGGDPKSLYLAGFSLGGYGVWSMAAMYPTKFAAIVPMSGRVLPRDAELKDLTPEILGLAKAADPYKAFAERIGRTPVWIFHGADDRVVPVDSSRRMEQALKRTSNPDVKYSEVPGAGHEPLGFQKPELFTWLREQKNQ